MRNWNLSPNRKLEVNSSRHSTLAQCCHQTRISSPPSWAFNSGLVVLPHDYKMSSSFQASCLVLPSARKETYLSWSKIILRVPSTENFLMYIWPSLGHLATPKAITNREEQGSHAEFRSTVVALGLREGPSFPKHIATWTLHAWLLPTEEDGMYGYWVTTYSV